MKKYLLFTFLSLAILILTGIGCKPRTSPEAFEAAKPKTLRYWRVFDDSDAFEPIIADYRAAHPNVSVEYRKLRPDEYERELINALAEDRGPDIFAVRNTAVREYAPKILPLPRVRTMPRIHVKQGVKQERIVTLERIQSSTPTTVRRNFLDVAAQDVLLTTRDEGTETSSEKIMGLPLAVDTLALFVNRDLLNAAGIPEPPATWDDFGSAVKKLTRISPSGKITQSGAALGTARNVERAYDILSVLMAQNGVEFHDAAGNLAFHQLPPALRGVRTRPPGVEALIFYTDFASPVKETYTWDESQPNSVAAFASGKTAFFFGFSYHIPEIRARAPRMNLDIVPIPQIPGKTINQANYWVETVSKKTKNPNEAWDFLEFLAGKDQVKKYLDKVKKPTALRSLVSEQTNNAELGPFASELLTAASWYRGVKPAAAEEAFLRAIDDVVRGRRTAEEAVRVAADAVGQTLR